MRGITPRNETMDTTTIRRASRNKTQYANLLKVGPSEDHKQIVFHFENGERLFYSVAGGKWCHGNTGLEMGDSHFKNIEWGTPTENKAFKPNKEGFYEEILLRAEEGWVRTYFQIMCRWIGHYAKCNPRESDGKISVRVVNSMNDVDRMKGVAAVAIESLAKNNYVQQMDIDQVCKLAFQGSSVRDFKSIRDNCGMDPWFCQHLSEKSELTYVASNYGDTYEEGKRTLSIWVGSYSNACKNGMGDLWRHVWDSHKFAIGMDSWNCQRLKELVGELEKMGYKPKKVMDYVFVELPRQGIVPSMVSNGSVHESLALLRDYAKMCHDMNARRFDRYPKCLKMSHDIAQRNYKVNRSQIRADKYGRIVKDELARLEWKSGDYCVIAPPTLQSIVEEGSNLNHCVAAYVDRVLDRKTTIMFLRKSSEMEKSLITLEVIDGRVTQARGQSNRAPTDEEQKVIDQYGAKIGGGQQKEIQFEEADAA